MNRTRCTFWQRLWQQQQGIAMVEFAIALPLLMTLFYGCIEITRFVLISQKTEKLAHAAADVTAQSDNVTLADLDRVMAATGDIMAPFTMGANGRVILSSVYRAEGSSTTPRINWQYMGGGTLAKASKLGAVNDTPNLPAGFTVDERENVIVSEVHYQFSPLLTSRWFGTTIIYRSAFYKPRFGALLTPPT